MVRPSLLPRLLVILAVIALVVAPLPGYARGMPVDAPAVMQGMDCCPPDDPVMPDCQKSCPYLALCMAKCLSAANAAGARVALLDPAADSRRLSPDERIAARTIRPAAPPPRI